MFIFPVQLTTSRIGNLTRLIHTLLYVMTIHTYILYCNLAVSIIILLYLYYSSIIFAVVVWIRSLVRFFGRMIFFILASVSETVSVRA